MTLADDDIWMNGVSEAGPIGRTLENCCYYGWLPMKIGFSPLIPDPSLCTIVVDRTNLDLILK